MSKIKTCNICHDYMDFENCDGGLCDVCDHIVCDNCICWKEVLIEPNNYDVICIRCMEIQQ